MNNKHVKVVNANRLEAREVGYLGSLGTLRYLSTSTIHHPSSIILIHHPSSPRLENPWKGSHDVHHMDTLVHESSLHAYDKSTTFRSFFFLVVSPPLSSYICSATHHRSCTFNAGLKGCYRLHDRTGQCLYFVSDTRDVISCLTCINHLMLLQEWCTPSFDRKTSCSSPIAAAIAIITTY